jgi:hypothetical protein
MGVCRIEGASHATAHSLDFFGRVKIERKAKRNTLNMNTTEISVTVRQEYSWYLFLLEVVSTPGPWYD